jgi:trans-2-enoyl-CoA reductase
MQDQAALCYHQFGAALEVLRLESLPIAEPQANEVRVRLLLAVINPSDYGRIEGRYETLPSLPAVGGREGVGEIESIGAAVTGLKLGQKVRFSADGAWREYACLRAEELLLVPDSVPIEQAVLAFINPPTAYCLLRQFGELKTGDWVLQNAGNSAVGLSVIQMAKAMGLRTISQVRRENLIEPLQALGADSVVVDDSSWEQEVGAITGGEPIRLALNSVGGASAISQIKVLGKGGTQVTIGGMTGETVRFPTRYLIFNDIRLVGFWWDAFCKKAAPETVGAIMDAVFEMQANGALRLPIAGVYPLNEYRAAFALDHRPRLGKVLLRP